MTYQMYIDGAWCAAASREAYDAINPGIGEAFGKIAKGGREDAQRAIAAANDAQKKWAEVPLWERCDMCVAVADIIDEHKEDLRGILCTELGPGCGWHYTFVGKLNDLSQSVYSNGHKNESAPFGATKEAGNA